MRRAPSSKVYSAVVDSIEQVEAELLGGGRAAAAGPSESMADEDGLRWSLGELTAQQQRQQDDGGEEGIGAGRARWTAATRR